MHTPKCILDLLVWSVFVSFQSLRSIHGETQLNISCHIFTGSIWNLANLSFWEALTWIWMVKAGRKSSDFPCVSVCVEIKHIWELPAQCFDSWLSFMSAGAIICSTAKPHCGLQGFNNWFTKSCISQSQRNLLSSSGCRFPRETETEHAQKVTRMVRAVRTCEEGQLLGNGWKGLCGKEVKVHLWAFRQKVLSHR